MNDQVQVGKRTMRLALCATLLGAALATQSAHAVVITVDFSANPLSTVPFNIDGFYLNMVTGATGLTGLTTPGYDINPYFSGAGGGAPLFRFLAPASGGVVGAAATATPLALGSTVGAASTFISGVMLANAATPSTNYFGIKLVNEATGGTNYGYIVVSQAVNPVVAGSVKVLGYAYENTGLNITVAAIPEPSTTLLMLGGLLAAGAFRMRQTSARREQG